MLTIRNEEPRDYEIVERMTRNSFYNLYIPGCMEHYLVHIMREHKDFIPELDETYLNIRTALYRSGLSAQRLWKAADAALI